jgi:hypothetical protein
MEVFEKYRHVFRSMDDRIRNCGYGIIREINPEAIRDYEKRWREELQKWMRKEIDKMTISSSIDPSWIEKGIILSLEGNLDRKHPVTGIEIPEYIEGVKVAIEQYIPAVYH